MLKYLIVGGGPAGLSFAARLLEKGERDFLVLEAEGEAGGLCRSQTVDGAPLDIGGGHFLDVRRPQVVDFLFRFMPAHEWNRFERISRVLLPEGEVDHPVESHLWQLPDAARDEYLGSIARAGCNSGAPLPERFSDWIAWKLGERIAERYMLPYNRKLYGEDLDALGSYWLDKLPSVSYLESLKSCAQRRAFGSEAGHAQFWYPKARGYGEVWRRMAASLGERIRCGQRAVSLDFAGRTVTLADGRPIAARRIVTTAPYRAYEALEGLPESLAAGVQSLRAVSIEIRYSPICPKTRAQWIYCPDPALPYHRILVRENFLPGSRGCWLETRSERAALFPPAEKEPIRFQNDYAYPLNTIGKPEYMRRLLNWAEARGVYGLGRWGEHQHYNSDAVVERALSLADRLTAS